MKFIKNVLKMTPNVLIYAVRQEQSSRFSLANNQNYDFFCKIVLDTNQIVDLMGEKGDRGVKHFSRVEWTYISCCVPLLISYSFSHSYRVPIAVCI